MSVTQTHIASYLLANMLEQVHRTSLREKASLWPYTLEKLAKLSSEKGKRIGCDIHSIKKSTIEELEKVVT